MFESLVNKIILGDCLEIMKQIPNESVDFILTDPPYGIGKKEIVGDESLNTYKNALPDMLRVLKNNSWFITFASLAKLSEVMAETTKYFEYVWLGVIYYQNMERILHTPVGFSRISLFLVFKKGLPRKHYFLRDVLVFKYGKYSKEIIGHPSPKPVDQVCELVKFGSLENDIVLDPFLGSGTTAVACRKLKRRYIGIEIDENYYKLALHRVEKEGSPTVNLEEVFGSNNKQGEMEK